MLRLRHKESILREMGIDTTDPNKAYQMVVDSLALIAGVLNEDPEITIANTLNNLDISIRNKEIIHALASDVKQRINRVSYNLIKKYQYECQKLINFTQKKKLAMFFTKPVGLRIMSEILWEFYRNGQLKEKLIIADPFMGSGLTLTSAVERLGKEKIEKVWGIERHPLPAIVGYSALIFLFKNPKQVAVLCGDAFKKIWNKYLSLENFLSASPKLTADVILTNPPFTRWENLDGNYRKFLLNSIYATGYSRYINRKQLNLQVISLFLIDSVLEKNGLLISVLPASTFYTIYGKAIKKLLRDKYDIYALIETRESSFSVESGFKELIIVCRKNKISSTSTLFITITDEENVDVCSLSEAILKRSSCCKQKSVEINTIDLRRLIGILDKNWLILFGENKLRDIIIKILIECAKKKTLIIWQNLLGKSSIIRGVEMYGPDFFLLPNRYWDIIEDCENSITIKHTNSGKILTIDKEYLVPALRRPSLYTNKLCVNADHYFLSIPPKPLEKLPEDLRQYIKWGVTSNTADSAIRNFGSNWYSHVYYQITKKNPFGRLFIPDKVSPTFKNRGVFAIMSKRDITATKNFYIVKANDPYTITILALWLNSTIFLSLLILGGRKISEQWTRFLEDDYLNLLIPNLDRIPRTLLNEANSFLESFSHIRLPPLRQQLFKEYRCKLDSLVLKMIGVKTEIITELHESLAEFLEK